MNNNLKEKLILLVATLALIIYFFLSKQYGTQTADIIFNNTITSIELVLTIVILIFTIIIIIFIVLLISQTLKKAVVKEGDLLSEVKANRLVNNEKINGKLYLTEEKLSFLPLIKLKNDSNLENQAVQLKLDNIINVKISNNIMEVITESTDELLMFEGKGLYAMQQVLQKLTK